MNQEQALQFVQDRLRQQNSPLHRELHLRPRERVLRRIAMEIEGGSTRVLDRVDGSVMVRCASGSLWITQDGDPKDVILAADESYRAERSEPMHLSALQSCVVEIEFEDEVMAQ